MDWAHSVAYWSRIPGGSTRRFFFTRPATTEIYTLSLHDALPIWVRTPSLSKMWRMWTFTVASLMNNAFAMSLFASLGSRALVPRAPDSRCVPGVFGRGLKIGRAHV